MYMRYTQGQNEDRVHTIQENVLTQVLTIQEYILTQVLTIQEYSLTQVHIIQEYSLTQVHTIQEYVLTQVLTVSKFHCCSKGLNSSMSVPLFVSQPFGLCMVDLAPVHQYHRMNNNSNLTGSC